MRKLAWVLAAALSVVAFVWVVSGERPDGPVPVVWDKTACAHCRMHVGEPAFAAQLQTEEGRVLDFDDPGCLFEYLDKQQPRVKALYFHHVEQDRWLSQSDVGFVSHARTPMGYGLAAVERQRSGALSFEQAREQVRAKGQAVGRTP